VKTMKKNNFDLDKYLVTLVKIEPFFAYFSQCISKVVDYSIPTIGVSINDRGYYQIHYNPDYMSKWPPKIVVGILKHEFYHIILEHIDKRLMGESITKDWNVATDLSINSYLVGELPPQALFPGEGEFKDLEPFRMAEYYYHKLPKNNNQEPFDSHGMWGDDNKFKGIAAERAKQALEEAVKESVSTNGWGSIPKQIQRQIEDSITKKLDWKSVVKFFCQKSIRGDRVSTRRRRNRRYGLVHPGSRRNRYGRIAIARDESASVSDSFWAELTAEMRGLAEIIEFTVIPFDTVVQEENVFVWNKNQNIKSTRKHCGGTNFNAPTEYVNERNFDGLIIMTDMEAPEPIKCKVQRLWITNRKGLDSHNFKNNEKIISID